ncbi:MAG: hypothetical protein LIO86_02280 [Lachnospiraceae bacterium]|nr:hypothetical protein [Lachnospiraceae bacterium]
MDPHFQRIAQMEERLGFPVQSLREGKFVYRVISSDFAERLRLQADVPPVGAEVM